jgi:hypothetical protein
MERKSASSYKTKGINVNLSFYLLKTETNSILNDFANVK